MTTFFLTDKNGTKHSLNEQQLQALAAKGKITPNTPLEAEGGHQGLAGQIPGLQFNTAAAPPPFAQPAQTTPAPSANVFCTNCGAPVSAQAVVCMSCGAKSIGHRKFCRQCGVALNPEQVVCIKCGNAIEGIGRGSHVGGTSFADGSEQQRSHSMFILFALLFGGLGVHHFYVGRKRGVVNIFLSIAILVCLFVGYQYYRFADIFSDYGFNVSTQEHKAAFCFLSAFVLALVHITWIIIDIASYTTDTGEVSRSVGGGTHTGTSGQKSKWVAGLLAIFLGGIGAHKYYMGSWGWGIVFPAATIILACVNLGIVTGIIAFIEGIMFLVMSEETFEEKYPPETVHPFRW